MSGRKPSFNIRLSYKDGREQEFASYSGKDIKSKWRNLGAAWDGKYPNETPYNLTFEKGTKLLLADGTTIELDECYLDLRVPYDPDRKPGGKSESKPAAKTKPADKPKRKAVDADPFG